MAGESSKRQLTLSIDLGGEQVLLERVEAVESLARPFIVTVDLFSTLGEIDLLPHLGKPASIKVNEDDEFMRYFHGIVVEGELLSERQEGFHYRLVLRPWTYLLSQNRSFAIFQDMSTIDIIKQVIQHAGFAHIDFGKLHGAARMRHYCVQYGESDFAFIARLLEEDGYYYHFEHTAARHTMVLSNAPESHSAGKVGQLTYNPDAVAHGGGSTVRGSGTGKHFIGRWTERVATGGEAKVTLRDFDFEKPQRALEQVVTAPGAHPLDAQEVYDWPGRYTAAADGTLSARVQLEARRAGRQTYSGETPLPSLTVGQTFRLVKHPAARLNQGYLISRAHHVLATESYRSGQASVGNRVFVEAVPATVKWHAPQLSPRPVVRGPETAIVTGPSGEEIHTDKYGRVKVRFHWDRSGTAGERSTCWIRVSQTGGLGNIILPRVGHEVIVDFLNGDPDQPIVVGRVFNGSNMPVYALPDHKTRALWRTKRYGEAGSYGAAATLDTGAPGANELRFEDKGGKEEVFLHAERDMNVRVRHSETHNIGLDLGSEIGGARKVKIAETDTLEVGKSIKIKAGTTIEIEAGTSITFKVGKSKMVMDPTSVSISTTMYKMDAKATADLKSAMTTVKGDGILTLKGGLTTIN